ncbi:MAG: transcription elongation factor GreA, partial [Oscillospiraceae bacterium]|nr:transcription elongation factor GreA [Oscillospiraceae bacterium]
MANPVKLTPKRLKELQDEMVWMKTVREKEVAEQIKEARSFGDLSENSEYDEAKNEQGKLYSREAEVQAILDNYILIEEEASDDTVINLGCTVTVLDLDMDE